MGKGRPKKCVLCGLNITDVNDSVPYKGRYAHSACFRAAVKVVHTEKNEKLKEKETAKQNKIKPKAELKKGITEEEYIQKKLYYDYLHKELGTQLPAKVYAVTDNYINKYSFTFQGMYQTLTYLKNILQKEFGEDIVGLIPYYYTEADTYYKTIKAIADNNKNVDMKDMYQHKTIYIDTAKKEVKQLDITSIGEDK